MKSPHRTSFALLMGLAALLLALAVAAIAAGTSYGKPLDLNGPARAVEGTVVDVRSPDRQDPAPVERSLPAIKATDAISPDAADAGAPGRQPVGIAARVHRPAVDSPAGDDGLEWWSAAAGAGAMIAIGLAGLTVFLAASRRRGAPGANSTSVATGH
jgi:hypothetical protein